MESKKNVTVDLLGKNNSKLIMTSSNEEFQKFIYELFDKNGILNDLRAYLRGHIVDVLRNSEIGNFTKCEQRFTQRLDLKFQALNILVAEYLLQQEFKYTSSVFVSEIPLPNMVFSFCKTLMKENWQNEELPRFEEGDIWTIFNYLGIKCDSVQACKIISTYKTIEKPSLLQCIINGFKFCIKKSITDSPEEVVSITSEASTLISKESDTQTCHHYACCRICQSNIKQIKQKYKKKIKEIKESLYSKNTADNSVNDDSDLTKTYLDKMFNHVTSIYENEIDRVREKERSKLKQKIELYTLNLETKKEKLEEDFKTRESVLQSRIEEKKKFLWDLAKSLREQHRHLSKAIAVVKQEGLRLNNKEENLKKQLIEAEELLTKRGEEMREQITKEILILENYLLDMKTERDNMIKEKELQDTKLLKSKRDSDMKDKESITEDKINELINLDNKRFLSIETELINMKNFINSKFESRFVEQGTVSDFNSFVSNKNIKISEVLNNEDSKNDTNFEDKMPGQVVNCLKKQNNISVKENFHNDSVSPRNEIEFMKKIMESLQEENVRLKKISAQQSNHIEQLNAAQERLQSELNTTLCTLHAIKTPTLLPSNITSNGHEVERDSSKNKVSPRESNSTCKPHERSEKKKKSRQSSTQSIGSDQDALALREAKLRLKRLEIEAEAVEKSYLEFKKKRTKKLLDDTISGHWKPDVGITDKHFYTHTGSQYSNSKLEENIIISNFTDNIERDFEKYLKDCKTQCDINEIVLKNKVIDLINVKEKTDAFTKTDEIKDFLTTPLAEFRKFYSSKPKLIKRSKELISKNKDQALSLIASECDEIKTNNYLNKVNLSTENKKVNLTNLDSSSVVINENKRSDATESKTNINIKRVDNRTDLVIKKTNSLKSLNCKSDENEIQKLNEKGSTVNSNLTVDSEIFTVIDFVSKDVQKNESTIIVNETINEKPTIKPSFTDDITLYENVANESDINIIHKQITNTTVSDSNNENKILSDINNKNEIALINDDSEKNDLKSNENLTENLPNTICVLVENTIETLKIPDSNKELEIIIDVNSESVVNSKIIENNTNIIKLNPQEDITDKKIYVNLSAEMPNSFKYSEEFINSKDEYSKDKLESKDDITKLDSQENVSFDIDDCNSGSNESFDSPVSHAASLDDFWNV